MPDPSWTDPDLRLKCYIQHTQSDTMCMFPVKAAAIYLSAWVLGIVGALAGVLLLMWLFMQAPTDPYDFDEVYCVDHPRRPITDSEVQAWIDSDGTYQRAGGYQCYKK